MNSILNENQLIFVKEYEFIKPFIHKIDSIIDNCIGDCHNKEFQTFFFKCEYDIQHTIIGNNVTIKLTIGDKSMNLNELNKKRKLLDKKIYFQSNK